MQDHILLELLMPSLTKDTQDIVIHKLSEAKVPIKAAEVKRSWGKRAPPFTPTADMLSTLKEGEPACIHLVSTRDIDSDREILMPKGVDLEAFLLNPVVFKNHDYSVPPIGKDEWITPVDVGLVAKTIYAPTQMGQEFWTLRRGNFLNTSSVGFIPLERFRKGDPKFASRLTRLAQEWPELAKTAETCEALTTKWLLIEHSDTAMPANRNTLTLAVAKGEVELSETMLKSCGISRKEVEAYSVPADTMSVVGNLGLKPYPNEHACRLKNPADFEATRRGNRDHDGKGYAVLYGRPKGGGEWVEQAFRYPVDDWSEADAEAHCKDHDGEFEPAAKPDEDSGKDKGAAKGADHVDEQGAHHIKPAPRPVVRLVHRPAPAPDPEAELRRMTAEALDMITGKV